MPMAEARKLLIGHHPKTHFQRHGKSLIAVGHIAAFRFELRKTWLGGCSIRLAEQGYARQRGRSLAPARAHGDCLCSPPDALRHFPESEPAAVVEPTGKLPLDCVAHVVVSAVGIAAHSQFLTAIPSRLVQYLPGSPFGAGSARRTSSLPSVPLAFSRNSSASCSLTP